MTATASPTELGYWINDADNHFNEPPDCFERYIDPKDAELAIRSVTDPEGHPMQLFAGQPSKFHSRQVTFSAEELQKLLGDTTQCRHQAGQRAPTGRRTSTRRHPRHAAQSIEPA